jgi:hypothetical protein
VLRSGSGGAGGAGGAVDRDRRRAQRDRFPTVPTGPTITTGGGVTAVPAVTTLRAHPDPTRGRALGERRPTSTASTALLTAGTAVTAVPGQRLGPGPGRRRRPAGPTSTTGALTQRDPAGIHTTTGTADPGDRDRIGAGHRGITTITPGTTGGATGPTGTTSAAGGGQPAAHDRAQTAITAVTADTQDPGITTSTTITITSIGDTVHGVPIPTITTIARGHRRGPISPVITAAAARPTGAHRATGTTSAPQPVIRRLTGVKA